MIDHSITQDEKTDYQSGGSRSYIRFFRDLKLLRIVFIPTIILSLAAVFAPQLFLWLMGQYAACSTGGECLIELPWVGFFRVTILTLSIAALTAFILRYLSWVIFEGAGEWSSTKLHSKLVASLGRTRVTYFDQNPSGRLINRLVRDWDQLRTEGIARFGDALQGALELLASACLALIAHPIAGILMLPTLGVFYYVQRHVSVMLQRVGIIRSGHLGVLLHRYTDFVEGARTFLLYDRVSELSFRLAGAARNFVQINLVRTQVEILGRMWSGIATSIYGFVVILACGYGLHRGDLTITLAAVIMTIVFRLAPMANTLFWHSTYLVESMGIARRVYEIVDLPREELEEGISGHQPVERLEFGAIEFRQYSMSYRKDTPIIIEGLDLNILPGEHLGIVGRTGAGKSSILQGLLRMGYLRGGDLLINGVSIYGVSPTLVRELVTVVPQDPYLFAGTVATNLDREGRYLAIDHDNALRRVGLSLLAGDVVLEGGKNLSLGERQLVCLARALLQRRPIVFLDEPTSGIDTISDAKIQRVLRTELREFTVITIAHRLDTLRGYDRVVQMESGRVKRSAKPEELLGELSLSDLV